MITEFGGIAFSPEPDRTWGYTRVASSEHFAERYTELLSAIHSLRLPAGFCYTQVADTYQEANGLFFADRTPQVSLARILAATRGTEARNSPIEPEWRERP